ncbi:carboxypeptidase-like regulatory domain-containing protein [Actinoplanes sp. NPDC024001]|uniref:carboxypeptidase-like regulatory domain-containing protein n=1 Tax=Actinoplanes sp. NPDC024001 TaxID=3154598 RepID=UPI0033F0EBEA
MTTHLRGRTTQAGAFLALVVGLVAGVQTAALADPPSVQIQSLSSTEVDAGSTVTMQYTVSNPGPGDGEEEPGGGNNGNNNSATIKVSGMSCRGDCSPVRQIQQSESFTATLTAPNVNPGEQQSITVTVTATINGETGQASQTVVVRGPEAPQTVRQVSGTVRDNDGKKLSGVSVAMQDSAGHQYDTTTNGDGGFSFTSSDSNPIAPGRITVGAIKDGYQAKKIDVQGNAGRSVSTKITLKKLATETPSASPSVSASATVEPTEEPAEDDATEEDAASAPPPNTGQQTTSGESGGSNWLLIIMGALLVAAGIGAFILVWLRRKNSGGEDSSLDGPTPGFGGPGGVPATGNQFDATRVAAPVGAGPGGDATMVAPAGGMPGDISNAPTMVHRPVVEDEFPDPYGAPVPPAGGFAGNQWGGEQGGGYGGDQPYGQQTNGYGGPQGGYGNEGAPPQRYDEHTSLYQPEQSQQPQQPQRYDEHTSLYQPEPGGYGDQGGYGGGQPYGQQGGYDDQGGWGGGQGGGYGPQQGGGYDQQQYGYDQQQQGGYGDQGGYGGGQQQYGQQQGGGYGQQGGYDQQQPGGPYDDDGYDQQRPQQQGGYYGGPQQPGQRPNRDWMDD